MTHLAIDDSLVADVLRAIGVERNADVEQVVDAFRGWLPAGSTAKWDAIDRAETPPGAVPEQALVDRLDGSLASWSCWPYCTGLGAVLAAQGHDVRMAVEHLRAGAQVPLVDYHSVLVVDGELVDAYLGPSAPVAPGADVTRPDAWAAWVPGARPDHLGTRGGSSIFRYRQLADHLDERDIRAFCSISVTHSGVGRRRTAHWLRGGRLWFVREDDDGSAALRVTSGDGGPFTQTRPVVATGRYDDLVRAIDDPEADA
ncbi:hypothetical protein [Actinospongicola halichondriae]|uniref:hypothetical protein n=1 Tax=Actinospongicola halichondriae TaxID=3236844 RepID=UPI003D48BA99